MTTRLRPPLSPFFLLTGLLPALWLQACAPARESITWEPVVSPPGRNLVSLAADHQNSRKLYAALRSGEFFASNDRGEQWDLRGRIVAGGSVRTVVQHPEVRGQFFAATSSGLSVSTDGGETWAISPLSSGTQPSCLAIALDPWEPQMMVVSAETGLFRSTTGGHTWQGLPGTSPLQSLLIHPSRPGLIHGIRPEGGVVRSTDGGATWVDLTGHFDASGTVISQVIVKPDNPNVLCMGTGGGDLYRSETGGNEWELSHQGTGFSPVVSFAQSGSDNDTIFTSSGEGVLVSSDFGASWQSLGGTTPRTPVSLVVIPDSTGDLLMVYGEATGILRSGDKGETWRAINKGLPESVRFSLIRGTRDGTTLYAASGASLYRFRSDSGWISGSEGLPGTMVNGISISGSSDSLLYAATGSGPYYSNDAGLHWQPLGKTMTGTPFSFFEAHPSIANRLFGMTPGGMMISTDAGKSWNRTRPPMKEHVILTMSFHHANAGIIAIGTANRKGLVTRDGGINWDEARYGIEGSELIAMGFDSIGAEYVAWGSDGQGYLSLNKGVEWKRIDPIWEDVDQFRVALDRYKPWSGLALVKGTGIYYTESAGKQWTLLPVEPPPQPAGVLYWNAEQEILYLVSDQGNIFHLYLTKLIEKARKQ